MGLYFFLKPKADAKNIKIVKSEYSTFLIDNIYYVDIPKDWNFQESDRFRTATTDTKTLMCITNYRNKNVSDTILSKAILEKTILPFYEDFKTNGGY